MLEQLSGKFLSYFQPFQCTHFFSGHQNQLESGEIFPNNWCLRKIDFWTGKITLYTLNYQEWNIAPSLIIACCTFLLIQPYSLSHISTEESIPESLSYVIILFCPTNLWSLPIYKNSFLKISIDISKSKMSVTTPYVILPKTNLLLPGKCHLKCFCAQITQGKMKFFILQFRPYLFNKPLYITHA